MPLTSIPLKHDSNTQVSFRNPNIVTLQGNSGGLTLNAGSAVSDSLTLAANSNSFSDTNTGRIVLKERMTFSEDFTVAGTTLLDNLITCDSVITSGVAINIFSGFSFAPTVKPGVGQTLSQLPAFSAGTVIQHTASSSDTLSYYMGYQALPTVNPDVSSGSVSGISLFGYCSSPRVKKTGTIAPSLDRLDGFNTYSTGVFGNTDLLNATITSLNHFRTGAPVTGVSLTVTANTGLYLVDQTIGTSIYGIYSAMTAASSKYFIYDIGGADSYFKGTVSFGSSINVVSYEDNPVFYEDDLVFYHLTL